MNGPDASADRAFEKAPSCWANASTCHSDKGNPAIGNDSRRLTTQHTFGDSWSRPGLDLRTKALISVTIAATLGTRDPVRGQLRVALNNGVTQTRSSSCSSISRHTPERHEHPTAT
jgi:4-carboxymuconolactone decarboxylase